MNWLWIYLELNKTKDYTNFNVEKVHVFNILAPALLTIESTPQSLSCYDSNIRFRLGRAFGKKKKKKENLCPIIF